MSKKKHRPKSVEKMNPDMPASLKERMDLWKKMKRGDSAAIMKLSLMMGMINEEQYEDYERIARDYPSA